MSIFQNLIVKYTRGKGSSIKEDTAFRILGSIYYAVNACVQNQQDSSRSFLISKGNILEIYKKGIEILKETFCQCEKLYEEIKENRLRVPVKMYNDTIDAALPDFFKNYDIIFGAQDTYSSMDYPLVFDDMNIKGIFYIKQYLEKLKVETEFCNFFKESSILEILKGYGEKYKIDISQSPISVFQILIEQCAFLTLCQGCKKNLTISQVQFQIINKNLSGKRECEILSLIDRAFEEIVNDFHIKNPKLVDYINKYKDSFKRRLTISHKSGNLFNMVVVRKERTEKGKVLFRDGKRLSNYEFSIVVDEILKCQDVKNKIDTMEENVHSMEDYIDILDSECIFGNEYKEVFESLDDTFLALLGKTVFYDDLACSSFKLTHEQLINCRGNMEREWQNYYVNFLLGQSEKRIKNIGKTIIHIYG